MFYKRYHPDIGTGGFCPGGFVLGGYCPGDIVRRDIVLIPKKTDTLILVENDLLSKTASKTRYRYMTLWKISDANPRLVRQYLRHLWSD